jgi:hypothetical protein
MQFQTLKFFCGKDVVENFLCCREGKVFLIKLAFSETFPSR